MNKQRGFTLIELLVVIAIIAVLSVIGISSYQVANQKARNSRRSADVQQIRSALEIYRSKNNTYPSSTDFTTSAFTDLLSEHKSLTDPKPGGSCTYNYVPSGSPLTMYSITYCQEGGTDVTVYNP